MIYDFFTNKAQRQIAEIQMRKAMCTCNNTTPKRKLIDWTKPLVSPNSGVTVKYHGKQGSKHVISWLSAQNTDEACTVDDYGFWRESVQYVQNKEEVYRSDVVIVEVWKSKSGAFSTRIHRDTNKPLLDQTYCGRHTVVAGWFE